MRKPIAETVLTDGPIRMQFDHAHPLDAVTGYVVVGTALTSESIIRRDLAVVYDYFRALELARDERDRVVDTVTGYAVVESLYGCGCRSDGPYYTRQTSPETQA